MPVKKWGWIPNTSGDLFSKVYVREKIESHSSAQTKNHSDSFTIMYSLDKDDAWEIEASFEGCKAKISLKDERGICSIAIDEKMENIAVIIWNDFRKILDGCSNTPVDCTAMKKLVDDGSNIEASIANCFIDAMENSSDAGIHIVGSTAKKLKDWEGRTIVSMNLQTIIKSNHLYFERFVQMYEIELGEKKTNLEAVMGARYKKAKTVSKNNLRHSEFGFERQSLKNARISWIVAIIGIFAALCIGIINLVLK